VTDHSGKRFMSDTRLSTRLAFLAAGLAISAWAPLVPHAKLRLGVDEAQLGLLLLCLGAGSLLAMPVTSLLASRFGCRRIILWAGAAICLLLPGLALSASPMQLAFVLFAFGASIGALDVAMNIQAVIVERESGEVLMSGFHGLFSVGGFIGAGVMAALLWAGLDAVLSSVAVAVLVALSLCIAAAGLLPDADTREPGGSMFVMPHGAVIFIGALCFLCFLAEGAMLDWSALLLTAGPGLSAAQSGLGYAAFAVAMTVGRLTGDKVVGALGGKRVLVLGGLCAAGGFFCAVFAQTGAVALAGFAMVGLGASNIVPILFTAAGNQKAMPAGLAIGAITTLGYAGMLAGPALIGFVAHEASLNLAFAGLGVAMLLIAVAGFKIRVRARL
jgi:MFS family permease